MKPARHYADRSTKGARPYQEDDCGFYPHPPGGDEAQELLLVLADGMGGHRGGAHASKAAVETFIDAFNSSSGQIGERLSTALDHANRQVGLDADANSGLDGMGCTLVGVFVAYGEVTWISVGDSPLWLFRDGELIRLNADHSMGAVLDEEVRQGKLGSDQAAADPQRHALLTAVTGETLTLVDGPESVPLYPGDRIVLASDGLLTLSLQEIAETLSALDTADADSSAEALIAAVQAKEEPKQDNTTIMVVVPEAVAADEPATIETRPGGTPDSGRGKPRSPARSSRLLVVLLILAIVAGAGYLGYRYLVPIGGEPAADDDVDAGGRYDDQETAPVPSLALERTFVVPHVGAYWSEARSLMIVGDDLYVAGNRTAVDSGAGTTPWLIQLGRDLTLKREWRELAQPGRTRLGAATATDDGIVLAGSIATPDGDRQIWLHRMSLAPDGRDPTTVEYGGSDDDEALAALARRDGGVLVAGRTRSQSEGGWDGIAVLFDSDLSEVWARRFGGRGDDEFTSITGGEQRYVLAGSTHGDEGNDQDGWLVFIDENGTSDLISVTGQTGSDRLFDVAQIGEGRYVAVGEKGSETDSRAFGWLEVVVGDGSIAGELVFRDVTSRLLTVRPAPNSGIIAAGAKEAAGGDQGLVVRTDSALSGNFRESVSDRHGVISTIGVDGTTLWAAGTVEAAEGEGSQLWIGRYALE